MSALVITIILIYMYINNHVSFDTFFFTNNYKHLPLLNKLPSMP